MAYMHIFFDLDHTLWDFETNSRLTLEELYRHFGLERLGIPSFQSFHDVYSVHNDRLWERFRKGHIRREELRWKRMWYTLVDFRVNDESLAHELSSRFLEVLPTHPHVFPGTLEVLGYLKDKGYTLHLITNGFEQTQFRKLQYCGLGPFFTQVVTSEKAGSLKPDRGIFEYALKMAGSLPVEALMVGDALEVDILGAQQAGIDQVYFNPGSSPLGRIIPTFTIASLPELKQIL